jgi:hypothetical protein
MPDHSPLQPGEAELFLSYPFPRQPEPWNAENERVGR